MILWEQLPGPIYWRSRDRQYTVSETYADGRVQYRATYSGNLTCAPLGPLREAPELCKADAEAHAVVALLERA